MKTTIDLPEDLVRQLKLRALEDGRKLKDLAAELLRKGLHAKATHRPPKLTIARDTRTRLPVIMGGHVATPPPGPDDLHAILVDQEVECHRETA